MRRRIDCWILILSLSLVLLSACSAQDGGGSPDSGRDPEVESSQEAAEDESGAIRFTDMMGREIALDGPAARAVALTSAECEVFYALGAQDRLVGRGEYCDYPAEALALPMVQSGENINLEEILALRPDAVFMSDMTTTLEQVQAMEDAGIAVIVSESRGIEGVYELIEVMGRALALEEKAGAMVADLRDGFAAIRDSVPQDGDKPTIYFEVSPLEYGLWAAGTDTFMDEIAGLLGLENAFADVSGWREVSQEQVIERNPDYIVTVAMFDGTGQSPVDEIKGRPGWEHLTAVERDQVLMADSDEIARPGPRLLKAAEALYHVIYGAA